MKQIMISLALALSATSVMANPFVGTGVPGINDGFAVEFLSWCEGNKVVAENEEGKVYVRFNCEDEAKVCKVYDAYKHGRVFYSANCTK